GPRDRSRPVSEPPPSCVRPAGADADARGAGGDVRRRDRRPPGRRGRRGRRAPGPPPRARLMLHALAEPWTQDFLRRAMLELALVGIATGPLGCWVVFYELSYSAESLAHALFPGLVVATLAGIPLVVGGAAGLLVAAGAIAVFGRTPEIGRDTSVAVV